MIENNSFGDAVQPWQNTVYLSRDLILDGGDLTLGSDSEQSNLNGTTNAASPTQSAAFVDHFVIPAANTSPGTWYVIVKADSNDQVSEQPCFTLSTFCPSADGNGDNTVHATTTVHVLRSNLTVHGSGPDQGSWASNQIGVSGQFSGSENNVDFAGVGVGHTLDVTYVIENNSFGDAVQPWQNTVYLSRDLILDGGDLTLSAATPSRATSTAPPTPPAQPSQPPSSTTSSSPPTPAPAPGT